MCLERDVRRLKRGVGRLKILISNTTVRCLKFIASTDSVPLFKFYIKLGLKVDWDAPIDQLFKFVSRELMKNNKLQIKLE